MARNKDNLFRDTEHIQTLSNKFQYIGNWHGFLFGNQTHFIWTLTRYKPTPIESNDAKFIIESVIDRETGEAIDNATLVIHLEREGKDEIVFEEYDFSECVIEGEVGDIVSIEVTAPGYAKWHLVIQFIKTGVMNFLVELEREVEGIEGKSTGIEQI